MRYSTAVVLSTLAVGQAAAANLRHASFHARRQAEAKRSPNADEVDWSKVSYDLTDVDWSSVFAPKATATPTAAAASKVAEVQEKKVSATPTPEAEATSAAPSSTSEETPKETESSDPIGDLVDDLTSFVSSIVKDMGLAGTGANSKTANGGLWIGESDWQAEFTNDANKDMVVLCWESAGFTGMTLNVNKPAISVGIAKGESVTVSFEPGVAAACAPAFDTTKLAQFGGVAESWAEFTFGQNGAFDVSRNVNMNGSPISMKGSKCTSDMSTCVFKCTNGADSCEKGTDYGLENCSSSNGGGGGYDSVMQGVGGGCAMGSDSETVKVTFT